MITKFLIYVNGIPFCDPIGQYQKEYVLRKIAQFPELKVRVIAIEVEEAAPA